MSDSLEDLLAQLRTEHQSAAIADQPTEPPAATQLSGKPTGAPLPSSSAPASPNAPETRSPTDLNQLLAELKTFHLEQEHQADLAAQLEQERQHATAEHQRVTEQRHQETLTRQRRAAQIRRAETWLQQLDPHGGEGVWFEEFAAKYDSRLEAAIDYLGAMETEN